MAPLLDPAVCEWDAAQYLIFSDNVFASYIYYSHLFPAISALILGLFVWLSAPKKQLNTVLLLIALTFSAWTFIDLVLWATEKTQYTMFFWSIQIYFDLLLYVATLYLCYLFIDKQEPSLGTKLFMMAPFIPLWFLANTEYNLLGFDYSNCDREALEGPLWQYVYLVELLFVGWIAVLGMERFRRGVSGDAKREIVLIVGGALIFLLAFSWGNITGSLAIDWDLGQYGLFGMPIFLAFLSYLIVRYRGFGINVLAAQMLVAMIFILILAMTLLRSVETVRVTAAVTAVLTIGLGYMLVRSVKREVHLRESLEVANQQQESLLHFISHEVKGYLAEGQNAFAGIVEGDFGDASQKVLDISKTALGKMRTGVATVMDILDASNLKKGTMQYKHGAFDFKKAVETVLTDLAPAADAKQLHIETEIALTDFAFTGDEDKLKRHVIRNLIDNAIRYTPHGSIHVSLQKNGGIIRFAVKDSGVGISDEDKKHLFTEGGKGKDSLRTNVNSTGYGLFVAKSVVTAHGGKIWAESEGEGRGSTFVVELPISA